MAQSPPPWRPGLPARKSPLRGALSLFLQAFGSGTSLHPCRLCPLGASLRLAPALRKRFVDFQPDQAIAVVSEPFLYSVIAGCAILPLYLWERARVRASGRTAVTGFSSQTDPSPDGCNPLSVT
ncbi:hypothetical protein EXN74_19625 [Leclercia adecarboxylata]|nr:hypothetical protein EXN74_19625 [Leclercia adecarboxylata]QFH49003.1 hypothetical protein FR819_06905 [Leclercia adecarboxylata]QIG32402.1 hypothetical protein FY047_06790 [Leclercia adecarboxylata]